MVKWEYLVVEFFPDIYVSGLAGLKSGSQHRVIENGSKRIILNAQFAQLQVREHGESSQKHDFPELPEFVDYLNDLGSKGWEMVTRDDPGRKYIFKRPRAQAG